MLAERGEDEYVVFHGSPPPGEGHAAAEPPFAFPNRWVTNRSVALRGGRSITYQAQLRPIIRSPFDAVVLGTHLQFISNHLLFLASRCQHRTVLYWGHGSEKVLDISHSQAKIRGVRSAFARTGIALKHAASKLPDGYLVYTEGGAEHLIANGVPAGQLRWSETR